MSDSPHLQVLDESLESVFIEYGYDGATLTQLAQATGLSKASLYHHYPGGKAEMATALLRKCCARAQQLAFDKLLSRASPASCLINFAEGFQRYCESGKRACLVSIFAQAPMTPVAGHAKLALDEWRTALASTFAALLENKPKRATRLAEQMLAELYGALLTATILEEPQLLERAVKRWVKWLAPLQDADDAKRSKKKTKSRK